MTPSQTYLIGNMDCANCARELEEGVSRLEGVQRATVDFATTKLVLVGDVPFNALKARVEAFGKTLNTLDSVPTQEPPKRKGIFGFWDYLLSQTPTRFALLGALIMLLGLAMALLLPNGEGFGNIFYTIGMVVALYPIAKSGLNTLVINRAFNINLLMSVAAIGAIAISEYFEGALVIFLFAISEALEGYTADKARDSLRGLMALKPTQARLKTGAETHLVDVNSLQVSDVVVVLAEERLPMDGRILQGQSAINQAPITGESMPVFKELGDEVFAGTINGASTLLIEVTRLAKDNTLSRVIALIEEAQSQRAPFQRLIDRFAHYYTPSVAIMAFFVAILPPLLLGAPFYNTPTEQGWLYRALSMLVIACPCALVISTPVTLISAMTGAARRGVLIKGGVHLEALGVVKAIVFDKTGTLTQGKPAVQFLRTYNSHENDLLQIAVNLEAHSTHPIAHAILQYAQTKGITPLVLPQVQVIAGKGVTAETPQGKIAIGSHRFFDELYPHAQSLCDDIAQAEAQGLTTMLIYEGESVRGFVGVADILRPESIQAIDELRALGLHTILCSGDNAVIANQVGKALGMTDVRANMLPQDKLDVIQELRGTYGTVMMVGDGMNDTPSLAAATVGVAMGGAGSAQALETADVVLMGDDLHQLPYVVGLSRFSRQIVMQNVVLSLAMKLIFLGLAFFGGASLLMAIFADVGMSLIVTFNGMRPLKYQADGASDPS